MSHTADSGAIEQVLNERYAKDGYDRVTVRTHGPLLDLRIHVKKQDKAFGLLIPGPNSTELQPWLYTKPNDVREWASMLAIWLDESLTGGAAHLATEQRDEVHYLIAAPYGLRYADQAEHERLLGLAPRDQS